MKRLCYALGLVAMVSLVLGLITSANAASVSAAQMASVYETTGNFIDCDEPGGCLGLTHNVNIGAGGSNGAVGGSSGPSGSGGAAGGGSGSGPSGGSSPAGPGGNGHGGSNGGGSVR